MTKDLELWKIAIDIEESGIIDTDKQEYDFDIDLLIRLRNENDKLKRSLNVYVKQYKYWKWKYMKEREKRHIYKVEMGRLRRKLTRIYAYYNNWFDPLFDRLKKL